MPKTNDGDEPVQDNDDVLDAEILTGNNNVSWRTYLQQFVDASDQRWAVLVLLFGVTGVLGLPVLWASRGFQWPAKIFWSIAATVYTALLFWMAYSACNFAWQQFNQPY